MQCWDGSRRELFKIISTGAAVSLSGCLDFVRDAESPGSSTTNPSTDIHNSEISETAETPTANTIGPLSQKWNVSIEALEPIILTGENSIGLVESTDGPAIVNKISTEDGSEIGRFRLPTAVSPSTIALRDGKLIGCGSQTVFVVDWQNGSVLRKVSIEGFPLGQSIAQNTLYLGLRSWEGGGRLGKVQAFSLDTLSSLWTIDTETNVNTGPVVSEDQVFATIGNSSSEYGTLHAYDRQSQESLWQRETAATITAAPIIADGTLYAATYGNYNDEAPPTEIFALNPADGNVIWERTDREDLSVVSKPIVVEDDLLLGSRFTLERLSRTDGSTVWKQSFSEGIISPIAIDGDFAYVATRSGELLALEISNGEIRWRDSTSDAISSISVTDNSLYLLQESTVTRLELQ